MEQQSLAESSADVNQLALLNRSGKPLYLMPGEIIVGGRQDRTIAQEYVIPPGNKPVTIEVFCVEHGRWAGRGAMETTTLVNGAMRAQLWPKQTDLDKAQPPAREVPPLSRLPARQHCSRRESSSAQSAMSTRPRGSRSSMTRISKRCGTGLPKSTPRTV